MVDQSRSKILSGVDQLELLPGKRALKPSAPVDKRYLFGLQNLRRAIRYSISLRDLEPKAVYEPLGKDAAVWSRIENGGMSFPADDLLKLAEVADNQAPLMWLAYRSGYELSPLRDALEVENAELRTKLAQAEHDKQLMVEVFRQVQR